MKITFDLQSAHFVGCEYKWQRWYDAFCICRNCDGTVVFILSQKDIKHSDYLRDTGLPRIDNSVNNYFNVERFRNLKDHAKAKPPDHVTEIIKSAFEEGATCIAVGCFNAGATMFRLCVDHATRALLPQPEPPNLTREIRRSLGLRLKWLFDNGLLPEGLRELSACIKEDGNDGAHAGTLAKIEAEDLLDFTFALLERLYTEPERLRLAKTRRDARRSPTS